MTGFPRARHLSNEKIVASAQGLTFQPFVQINHSNQLVGIFLNHLIKLIRHLFIEIILRVPFSQSQRLFVFFKLRGKFHTLGLGLFRIRNMVSIRIQMFGVALPVAVRWMRLPFLPHYLE